MIIFQEHAEVEAVFKPWVVSAEHQSQGDSDHVGGSVTTGIDRFISGNVWFSLNAVSGPNVWHLKCEIQGTKKPTNDFHWVSPTDITGWVVLGFVSQADLSWVCMGLAVA